MTSYAIYPIKTQVLNGELYPAKKAYGCLQGYPKLLGQ
jgi:hypothetical protein